MDKHRAVKAALEITNTILASGAVKAVPYGEMAESVADFIEALAKRLEAVDDGL